VKEEEEEEEEKDEEINVCVRETIKMCVGIYQHLKQEVSVTKKTTRRMKQ